MGWDSPAQSQALALLVNADPSRGEQVRDEGWEGIPFEWRFEAADLWSARYGEPFMDFKPWPSREVWLARQKARFGWT